MKQVFKFTEQFIKEQQMKLEAVQELTMDKVLQELYFYIKKDVYGKPESDNAFYNRTEVLLKMFEMSNIYSRGGINGGVYGGIETNSNIFAENQNPEEWQNQSNLDSEPPISATDFVNIINNGVKAEHSVFGERPATHFWDEFLEIMYTGVKGSGVGSEYKRLFIQTAKELGYNLIEGNNYTAQKTFRSGTTMGKKWFSEKGSSIDIRPNNNLK